VAVERGARLASRDARAEDTSFTVGTVRIGGGGLVVCAGPCAVESEEQILSVARFLRGVGADLLRGGAYKPRTSPYSFRGLGREGLLLLARAREATGLPVVTEAIDEESLELCEQHADVVQIGARNMQNFALLRRAGRGKLPVFLKRGMSATLDELLLSAEHVLNEGNPRVILCERGIRTFSTHSRYTLDLSVVPAAQEATHLPIFVDPSHATGKSRRVASMALAAAAAGAAGVMLEVHPRPGEAMSDGSQAMAPAAFASLVSELRAIASIRTTATETLR
jgi:3-deoxy-7-phosphoheptulonate synthase